MSDTNHLPAAPANGNAVEIGTLPPGNANGRLPGQANLKLHFSNVSYDIKQNKSKTVRILNDTCGELKSGRLTAVLGPSGAGKTSMLNVLSGFKASGVSGSFKLNDEERNLLAFRKISSYIPQDFAMLELLTVQETLKVSTDLKLPVKTSATEKQAIIDDVLQILNMDKCRHTLVRSISGGERKRLSIAIELVTNPPIMFFDEPTSGLDSVASLQVINFLRRLARDGRIIVCVVHQPSSRLMKLFDDVLVMASGEVLYSGTQREMIPFFERAGYTYPSHYNPADFVLEAGSEEHNDKILALREKNKNKHCKWSTNKESNSHVDERSYNVQLTAEMLPKAANSQTSIELTTTGVPIKFQTFAHSNAVVRPKSQVSRWKQFTVLTRRSLRSMSRNMISVQLRLIMHVVVGVLLGIVFWNIGNDAAKVLTNTSCLFFMVLFVFFGNAMPSILLCPQETAVFIREYLNGWYSIQAYYAAKIIADIPMQFACPTFFVAIVYVMTGQPDDVGRFAMCWGICLLTGMLGHFFGLVFGSAFDMQLAVFLVPSSTIPFMIFSGFFIRLHELASFLRPLCDFSFFRYIMEGFVQSIYSYERADLECAQDFCYFKSPLKYLKEMDMLGDRYGGDILALLVWIVALKVLFFLSLVMRIRKAQ